MPYEKLRGKSIDEYRAIFDDIYCKAPITTFDGIVVKFYSNMFEHAFHESYNKKEKDKSLFSYNPCLTLAKVNHNKNNKLAR